MISLIGRIVNVSKFQQPWGLFLVQEGQTAMDEVGGSCPWKNWWVLGCLAQKVEKEGREENCHHQE